MPRQETASLLTSVSFTLSHFREHVTPRFRWVRRSPTSAPRFHTRTTITRIFYQRISALAAPILLNLIHSTTSLLFWISINSWFQVLEQTAIRSPCSVVCSD